MILVTLSGIGGFFILKKAMPQERIKPFLEQSASEFLQRKLTIGAVTWRISPLPALIGTQVCLWNPDGTPMVESPKIRVGLFLGNIFKKEIGITEMTFFNPLITLRRSKEGVLNVERMIDDIDAAQNNQPTSSNAVSLAFHRFTVKGGRVELIDENVKPEPLGFFWVGDASGRIQGGAGSLLFPFWLKGLIHHSTETGHLEINGTMGGSSPKLTFEATSFPLSVLSEFYPKTSELSGPLTFKFDSIRKKGHRWQTEGDLMLTQGRFRNEPISNASAHVLFHSTEAITLDPVVIHGLGGTLQANAVIITTTPWHYDLACEAAHIDLNRLARLFTTEDRFSGTASVKGHLSGNLDELSWVKTQGEVHVRAENGEIRNIPVFLKVLSKLNLASLFGDHEKRNKKTVAYDKASADVKLDQGQLSLMGPALIESKTLSIKIEGSADMPHQTITGQMVFHFLTLADEIIKVIPGIRSLLLGKEKSFTPLWVGLSGPLNDPAIEVKTLKSLSSPVTQTIGHIFNLPKDLINKIRGKDSK